MRSIALTCVDAMENVIITFYSALNLSDEH
jgi:hypothetical protein